LDLYLNGIGAEGAAHLAECLRVNAMLKSLNLHTNRIDEAGKAQLRASARERVSLSV
jgi:hypothetical protein